MELWIARDKNDYIGLYYEEPIWVENLSGVMDWQGHFMGYFSKQSFPEVTFENSPKKVELKLVEEL